MPSHRIGMTESGLLIPATKFLIIGSCLNSEDIEATKLDDWDDEADGDCSAPIKTNPAYMGKWVLRTIDNPDYKGPWIAKQIPNPEYVEDHLARQCGDNPPNTNSSSSSTANTSQHPPQDLRSECSIESAAYHNPTRTIRILFVQWIKHQPPVDYQVKRIKLLQSVYRNIFYEIVDIEDLLHYESIRECRHSSHYSIIRIRRNVL
ncbi:hypothetical protein GJ496_005701 [Pomphorhynchus laevis]|nr:hypothetical protein GJ496_005701 [Pomphorhynchus laevis]